MFKKAITQTILFLSIIHGVLAGVAYPRDSVFKLAYIATSKNDYPAINWSRKSTYPLKDDFSIKKSKEAATDLFQADKGISAALALGNNYFPYIEQKLKENKLSPSFKWIPFTLSGMLCEHYGTSGRAGLWQVPYVIGTKYGLQQNTYFDERLDYKKNTDVAIRYLKDLLVEFGDTSTALTAFFNGIGATKYAYSKTATIRFKDKESESQFIFNYLPQATRDDLYTWNELAATLSHPKNVFLERYTPINMAAQESVTLTRTTNIMAVAKVLDIASPILKAENNTLVSIFAPANYQLHLPLGRKKDFVELSEKIYIYQDSLAKNPRKRSFTPVRPTYQTTVSEGGKTYHYVKSGDNLGAIATKYGVGLSQLKSWNNLKNDMIYAGQKLVIYGSKNTPPATVQKPSPTTHATTTTSQGTFVHYTVKTGDTLWGIAQQFPGVSAEDIQKWNNIGERIDIGQVLKIKKE